MVTVCPKVAVSGAAMPPNQAQLFPAKGGAAPARAATGYITERCAEVCRSLNGPCRPWAASLKGAIHDHVRAAARRRRRCSCWGSRRRRARARSSTHHCHCVNAPPGSAHGLVCSHAETQLDRLSVHVRSEVHHGVDVAARIARPRHSARQRVAGGVVDSAGVAAGDKTAPDRWIGNVGEGSPLILGEETSSTPPSQNVPPLKFRVEIVAEAQLGRS